MTTLSSTSLVEHFRPERAVAGTVDGIGPLIIGLTGVGLSWVLAGAQWWRARRSVAGISVLTWSVFLALNATWAVYGVGVGNPYLVANGVGAALFNVALLWEVEPRRRRGLLVVVVSALVTGLALWVGTAISWQPVAAWCLGLAVFLRWPQVLRLMRSPDVAGVSLVTWVVAATNNLVWVVIAAQRDDLWLVGVNVTLTLSSLVLVLLCLWRRVSLPPARHRQPSS